MTSGVPSNDQTERDQGESLLASPAHFSIEITVGNIDPQNSQDIKLLASQRPTKLAIVFQRNPQDDQALGTVGVDHVIQEPDEVIRLGKERWTLTRSIQVEIHPERNSS